jgi:hypothetical protein
MKFSRLVLLLGLSAAVVAQHQLASASQTNSFSTPNAGTVSALLAKVEQEAEGLNMDVGRLHVERWKTDGRAKQQANENVASIQRNVTAALPGLVTAVRSAPDSLAANFKLYRNLNALSDVVASVGESAGAFGKREEYDAIAAHTAALDDLRRDYATWLQQMAVAADSRLAAARQAQTAAKSTPPKKIVVDDSEAATTPKKKKSKKPVASGSPTATSAPR